MFGALGSSIIQGYVQQAVEYETKHVTFNHICQSGYGLDQESTNRLSKIAQELGTIQGYSATESLNQFSSMLARRSMPMLDCFGIATSRIRQLVIFYQSQGMNYNEAFIQAVLDDAEWRLNGIKPVYQVVDLGNGYGKVKLVLSNFGGGFVVPSIDT